MMSGVNPRMLIPLADVERCQALVGLLDKADPNEGWGSMDRDDVIRNVPLLVNVADQYDACAACVGLAACTARRSGPRGTIARRMWITVDAAGSVTVHASYGSCDLKLAALQHAAQPTRTRRRRRGEDDVPF